MKKKLCATVIYKQPYILDIEQLKSHLQEIVPKYSVPTHFDSLDELPRTKNGKIDYGTLEKQFQEIKELL